jgi:hypothetical protein
MMEPKRENDGKDDRRIIRRMDTPENRRWWEEAERIAREVRSWPAWKRAGIDVYPV